MEYLTSNHFKDIVLKEIPLIDVRAPIEFNKGAFPGAVNLPIMDDEERRLVGTKYKEAGNEKATALGYHLVSGDNKVDKITAWVDYIHANPQAMIYCFRGGSRSRISQEWIQSVTGKPITRLEGGYKAFRTYLMNALLADKQAYKPIRLTGHTGSAKTDLLLELDNAIDLEGIANHRGSAFGDYATGQPSQINFENQLAYHLIQKQAKGYEHMVFEDEGRHVGKCFIPKDFVEFTKSGDYVVLDVPFEERVQITLDNYVIGSQEEYLAFYGPTGISQWHDYILSSLQKIKKRLGGLNHKTLVEHFEAAYKEQITTGSYEGHKSWISWLLGDYYDPMYAYQMEQIKDQVAFHGDRQAVLDYLKHHQ